MKGIGGLHMKLSLAWEIFPSNAKCPNFEIGTLSPPSTNGNFFHIYNISEIVPWTGGLPFNGRLSLRLEAFLM